MCNTFLRVKSAYVTVVQGQTLIYLATAYLILEVSQDTSACRAPFLAAQNAGRPQSNSGKIMG